MTTERKPKLSRILRREIDERRQAIEARCVPHDMSACWLCHLARMESEGPAFGSERIRSYYRRSRS